MYISTDEELFVKFIADSELEKYTRNIKTLYAYADEKNIDVENIVFDIELAAYLIEPSSKDYSDKNLCASYEIALPVCTDERNENTRHLPVTQNCAKNSEIKSRLTVRKSC